MFSLYDNNVNNDVNDLNQSGSNEGGPTVGSEAYERFQTDLTEKLARVFESGGLSPLVGRIYSLLIASPEPVSLQEMAKRLGVTKAAVSIQVRVLEMHGLCVKRPRGKDRRNYYGIPDDHLKVMMRGVTEKLGNELKWIEEMLARMPSAEEVEPEERKSLSAIEQRYSELLTFYRLVIRRLEGIEEEMDRLLPAIRGRHAER